MANNDEAMLLSESSIKHFLGGLLYDADVLIRSGVKVHVRNLLSEMVNDIGASEIHHPPNNRRLNAADAHDLVCRAMLHFQFSPQFTASNELFDVPPDMPFLSLDTPNINAASVKKLVLKRLEAIGLASDLTTTRSYHAHVASCVSIFGAILISCAMEVARQEKSPRCVNVSLRTDHVIRCTATALKIFKQTITLPTNTAN